MKKINKVFISIGLLFFFLFGCTDMNKNKMPADKNSDKIQIVTSIYPVYEIVKEVAGSEVDVYLMVGANEDAHHYEPNATAINMVNEADFFIYGNDLMEFWVDKLLGVVENDSLEIVELVQADDLFEVEEEHAEEASFDDSDHDHDHDHGGLDPHFWLDPLLVQEKVLFIADKLIEADPKNKELYEENSLAFSNALEELHKEYEQELGHAKNRIFVVQHQSFGHLAKRYDLEQVAIGGLLTEVEPDPKSLIERVKFIRSQNVPVVYYQSGENSAIAVTIAKETGTTSEMLYDLENKPAGIEGTEDIYLKTMRYNLEQLKKSIQ